MPAPGQPWPLDSKVISCCFHVLAISSGIFRSWYRWYTSRFGWEDTWALLALVTDVGCLVCSWAQQPTASHLTTTDVVLNFVAVCTLTSVPWAARLSMIAAVIRITDPHPGIRRASYGAAISFGVMWVAVLAQKLYICTKHFCNMTHGVAVSQLTTDVISDTILMVMPIFFLKDMKISRTQRLLLIASFSSSICITIVSIAHSVSLFFPPSSRSILIVYIKAALALLICNLLVIVMFIYRLCSKTDADVGATCTKSEPAQFTTVIPEQLTLGSLSCSPPLSRTSTRFISSSRA